MRSTMFLASFLLLISGLGGCEESYEEQEQALVNYVQQNRMGSGSDYWLVKGAAFGGPVRIGLIFGYPDDGAACDEAAEMMNKRYPSAKFHCTPAN